MGEQDATFVRPGVRRKPIRQLSLFFAVALLSLAGTIVFIYVSDSPSSRVQFRLASSRLLRFHDPPGDTTVGSCNMKGLTARGLANYLHFHAEAVKGGVLNTSARTLTWSCPGRLFPGDRWTHCKGMGDRYRGIIGAFTLAVATQRVFLIDVDDSVFPIRDAIRPRLNGIEWDVTGGPASQDYNAHAEDPRLVHEAAKLDEHSKEKNGTVAVNWWENETTCRSSLCTMLKCEGCPLPVRDAFEGGGKSFSGTNPQHVIVAMRHFDWQGYLSGDDEFADRWGCEGQTKVDRLRAIGNTTTLQFGRMLTKVLFRLEDTLADDVARMVGQLASQHDRPNAVSIHVRTGFAFGERSYFRFANLHDPKTVVKNVIRCANEVAHCMKEDASPMMLIASDDVRVKAEFYKFSNQSKLWRVTVSEIPPRHIAFSNVSIFRQRHIETAEQQFREDLRSVLRDVALLSVGQTLVSTGSSLTDLVTYFADTEQQVFDFRQMAKLKMNQTCKHSMLCKTAPRSPVGSSTSFNSSTTSAKT